MRGKQRSKAQVLGDEGVRVFEGLLPKSWVKRTFEKDYGLDLSVEIFEEYKDGYITTGEHIYFQVKGTENLKVDDYEIKGYWNVDRNNDKFKSDIKVKVVKYPIDTALLSTVERMGSAVPVLLVVVDLDKEVGYYVCLNDYIEKVIIPDNPYYYTKKTLGINIPIENVIRSVDDVQKIEWYAKRAKLYAFFNKINYQKNTMKFIEDDELLAQVKYFARIISRFDAWSASEYFPRLKSIKKEIDDLLQEKNANKIDTEYLRRLWDEICSFSCIYEDTAKEWFLPTYSEVTTRVNQNNILQHISKK